MEGKYRFGLGFVILIFVSFFLVNRCRGILDDVISNSGFSYYTPIKFRDSLKIEGELKKVLTSYNLKDLSRFKILESGYVILEKHDLDKLERVGIQSIYLLGKNLYFIMSKSFSTMNKSYGILFSEEEGKDELKKYPILSISFLEKNNNGCGFFYFVEAKI